MFEFAPLMAEMAKETSLTQESPAETQVPALTQPDTPS